MRRLLRIGLAAAVVACAAGCGQHAPQQQLRQPDVELGWIRSIKPLGRGYLVWFDLGRQLMGTTGFWSTSAARCVEHGRCPAVSHPGGFPDDVVTGDLHYAQPFYLPPRTPVILSSPDPIPCTVRELYLLWQGRDPRHLRERDEISSVRSVYAWAIRVDRLPPSSPLGLASITRVEQQWHP